MPGLDPVTGTLTLPLWAAGAVTALLVVFCVIALNRAGREGLNGGLARIGLVLVGAILTWFFLEGTSKQDTAAERRAIEARASTLATRATMPGSPLACLDALAGDTVERSCERGLFATPEAMASAVSYVATQINLFADVTDFVNRGGSELEPLLASLRRSIESDRYGLIAHVLATRDGCTSDRCPAFTMMRDAGRITANLSQGTYDVYVGRHSTAWPAPAPAPTADAGAPTLRPGGTNGAQPPLPPGASAFAAPTTSRPNGELFFPSSDSIPPVNIMTSEPTREPETTGTAPARTPPRRPTQAPKQQSSQGPIDLNAARSGAPPAPQ